MGLTNNKGAGSYVRFKNGKFALSNDLETTYTELEGEVIGIRMTEDDFKGTIIPKINLTLTDGESNYILSVSFNSSVGTSLIGFLKNADLSEKLTLVAVSKKDDKGEDRNSILVKQNGSFLKNYYSKAEPHGLPPMKQVTINKTKQWDKSEMQDFLTNVILNELAPNVSKTPAAAYSGTSEKEKTTVMDNGDDDSSLPF